MTYSMNSTVPFYYGICTHTPLTGGHIEKDTTNYLKGKKFDVAWFVHNCEAPSKRQVSLPLSIFTHIYIYIYIYIRLAFAYPVALSHRGADESLTIFLHFYLSVAALMASHTFSPVHSYMLSDHFSLGRPLFLVPFTVP